MSADVNAMKHKSEWERYWRILCWNRLDNENFVDPLTLPQRCRTAWRQLAAVTPSASSLPSEFLYPLRAYRYRTGASVRLYQDDEQLVLYMSDFRDYLLLTHNSLGITWKMD